MNRTIKICFIPVALLTLIAITYNITAFAADIDQTDDFVIVTSTNKFHYPDCYHLERAHESNKDYYTSTIRQLIDDGNSPCEDCIGYVDYNPHSTTNRANYGSNSDRDYTTAHRSNYEYTHNDTLNQAKTNRQEQTKSATIFLMIFVFLVACINNTAVGLIENEGLLSSLGILLITLIYSAMILAVPIGVIAGLIGQIFKIDEDILLQIIAPSIYIAGLYAYSVYNIANTVRKKRNASP